MEFAKNRKAFLLLKIFEKEKIEFAYPTQTIFLDGKSDINKST